MSLRMRKDGRQRVQTLKTNGDGGPVHRRGEWETPTRCKSPSVARFGKTPLARLLLQHPAAKLRPLFCTTLDRTTWKVESTDATIEVALDQGYVRSRSDNAMMALCELELVIPSQESGPFRSGVFGMMDEQGRRSCREAISVQRGANRLCAEAAGARHVG